MRPNWKSKGRRIRDAKRRLDEVRVWTLTCRGCGHEGDVTIALRRLRAAKRLVCSECGTPIERRPHSPQPPASPSKRSFLSSSRPR